MKELSRKILLILTLGLISIVILIAVISTNYGASQDFVRSEDIEIHISNIKKQEENSFYIKTEIVNKSSLSLEKNNIFIEKLDENNIETKRHNSSSGNVNSSQSVQSKNSEEESNAVNTEVKGNLNKIPANSSVQIGITLQFAKKHNGSILLVFRSDQIRNDNDATKTRYTTLTKEINVNEQAFAN